ncbi:phospholipase D family protein [Alteribacillus sp. YIM 98480]|uniref:phospholipase D family protein n=1 Tax=Alteribacillus sp. YIM 98480 TaxID=2606599 RepID=UPI00131C7D67|nr:phospholipase D family protein [Alteribacillus sp. YIM 98480]
MKNKLKLRRVQVVLGVICVVFLVVAAVSVYGAFKPLPDGVSYEGEMHSAEEVEFLYDLTYEGGEGLEHDQVIFDQFHKIIEEADDFVLVDMFLFNDDYDRSMDFPSLSQEVADTLIEKKQSSPEMTMVVVTDRINTFYGSYPSDILNELKDNGIHVFFSNLKPLRDSNPIYSGIYRTFFQWFGTAGNGWLPNAFSPDAPDVTLRSYLELLNFKANHRKVVVTEKKGMVMSANPHDASAYHSNVAFVLEGNILQEMIETEKAAATMSSADEELFRSLEAETEHADHKENYQVQLLTEGKIKQHVLQEIADTKKGETVTMGAFYLSDRDVINALIGAADKGAEVKLLLDANKDAFGREKNGIPNRPVANELVTKTDENIDVRWYRTNGEQYHTKMMIFEREEESTIIGGSANYTKRNLHDLNLETNVKITGASSTKVMEDAKEYFETLWTNENYTYTADFEAYEDESRFSYFLYRFQEWSGMSGF